MRALVYEKHIPSKAVIMSVLNKFNFKNKKGNNNAKTHSYTI